MILGVIHSRSDNNTLNRNIDLLNGKPLIAYTVETARRCSMLTDVIVSTNNSDTAAIAMEYGVRVPFSLTETLYTQETSGWMLFLHILEMYEKQFGKEVNYIVDMDINVPLKTAADIDGAVNLALQHPETDVVVTGYRSHKNPYVNMVELTRKGYVEIIKQMDTPLVRRQDVPKVFSIAGALVFKKTALYNYSHWRQAICRLYEVPQKSALHMDDEVDAEMIQLLLNSHAAL